jgi:hypothetical protein
MPSGRASSGWVPMVDDGTDRTQSLYRFFADVGKADGSQRH